MPQADLTSRGLDKDIAVTHERFVLAMQTRLPDMNLETKERYFAVLSKLVSKLEVRDKHLREILDEMVSESGAILLSELGSSR
jgi:hypothetical protein